MNYLRTGYKSEGLLDVHFVTDEDIEQKTSYASKIGAVTDAARPARAAPRLAGRERPTCTIPSERVSTVREFIDAIERDTCGWPREGNVRPWFRGQANAAEPPLPSVLRREYDQVRMTLTFQNRASAYHDCPPQDEPSEWLFLMQHYGLPTRLLDWTESPLIACLFAVEEVLRHQRGGPGYAREKASQPEDMGIWVIHPIRAQPALGHRRVRAARPPPVPDDGELQVRVRHGRRAVGRRPAAWSRPGSPSPCRPATSTCAWRASRAASRCTAATGAISRRCSRTRRSSPTGSSGNTWSRATLAEPMLAELDQLGISYATLFADLQGLSTQLKLRFRGRPSQPVPSPFNRRTGRSWPGVRVRGWTSGRSCRHPSRSTRAGSIRDARRAGSQPASAPTPTSTAAAAPSVHGSRGCSP